MKTSKKKFNKDTSKDKIEFKVHSIPMNYEFGTKDSINFTKEILKAKNN